MQLFKRGIVLPFQKGKALERGIEDLPHPTGVRLPIAKDVTDSPIGDLKDGAPFAKGQQIFTTPSGLPVISTVSGQLTGTVVTHHPLYGTMLWAELDPYREDELRLPVLTEEELTADKIIDIAKQAAVFDELDGTPLWEKLRDWRIDETNPDKKRLVLVADATENDIYGSSAWAVLMEQPRLVLFGLQMAAKALGAERYHIATMLPKRRRRTLKRAVGREYVFTVPDEYPVTVFGDKRDIPLRIGVQSCLALGRALKQGLRHTAAIVTVAGNAVPAARNIRVPFGTDLSEVLTACQADNRIRLILGDNMTGVVCSDLHTPLLPGITTVLAMTPHRVRLPRPCIGCGRCAQVCHAGLLPYEIARRSENMHYERLRHLAATECDGCAACSYVCPSGRNVAAEVLKAGETEGTMFLDWGEDDHE